MEECESGEEKEREGRGSHLGNGIGGVPCGLCGFVLLQLTNDWNLKQVTILIGSWSIKQCCGKVEILEEDIIVSIGLSNNLQLLFRLNL